MTFRRRQDPRSKIDRPAWISVDDALPLRKCTLIDLSDGGAKLALEGIAQIPNKFSLWLSRDGYPRYLCRIVWSDQNTMGIEFSAH